MDGPIFGSMTKGRYLDTRNAAKHLGISHSWLAHVRLTGGGPRWIALPNTRIIRYDVQDLDEWMASLKAPKHREDISSFPGAGEKLPSQPGAKRQRGRPTKAETIARRRVPIRP